MARTDRHTATVPAALRRGWWLAGALALALAAFAAGRLSAAPPPATGIAGGAANAAPHLPPGMLPVQNSPAPDDPRELIPLPGPGQQPVPGEGQAGECPLFLFQDGQLFRFDNPGGVPGGQPGGGGSPELFPLQPAPQPGQPLPAPPEEEQPLDLVLFDSDHATLFAGR